jgi:hypothetical protein
MPSKAATEKVRRLVEEGMSERMAREQVLSNPANHSAACPCGSCP